MPDFTNVDLPIERLTHDDDRENVHAYFKLPPWSPDGRKLLYFSYAPGADTGEVRVANADGSDPRTIGTSAYFTLHAGAMQFWADAGRKVAWNTAEREVNVHDLDTGADTRFAAHTVCYSGPIEDQLLDIVEPVYDDAGQLVGDDTPGIYLVGLDGTGRRCLATLDDLISANPQGYGMRKCGLQFRLGAEFRPDHRKVVLFLVTKESALVRDYYLCDLDGSGLVFLGAIGMHIVYHPNCRDILSLVKSGTTPLGQFADHRGAKPHSQRYSRLAAFDVVTHEQRFLTDYHIPGSGGHPSPSPDGRFVVIDAYPAADRTLVLLYDTRDDVMYEAASFASCARRGQFGGDAEFMRRGKMNPHPVFSPCGRKILYNSDQTGTTQVYQITLPEGF